MFSTVRGTSVICELVQSNGSNSAFSHAVQGDIALSMQNTTSTIGGVAYQDRLSVHPT